MQGKQGAGRVVLSEDVGLQPNSVSRRGLALRVYSQLWFFLGELPSQKSAVCGMFARDGRSSFFRFR